MPRKDNTTLGQKVALRRDLLAHLPEPCVLETHGGLGRVWYRCYSDLTRGAVCEKDPGKAEALACQRPSWAVYEGDASDALLNGAAAHLPINLVDIDPYGEPWPVLQAFFAHDRSWPDTLGIAVNDGLRQKLKANGGWSVGTMQAMVRRYGNGALYANYLDICRELVEHEAAQRGDTLALWAGYYAGYNDQMTHYAALFRR
jgi:hypothetical protein